MVGEKDLLAVLDVFDPVNDRQEAEKRRIDAVERYGNIRVTIERIQ